MKSFKDYIEEAKDPSRRDFLKGVAGAAASAASPNKAAAAVKTVAKSVLPAPKAINPATFGFLPPSYHNKNVHMVMLDWEHPTWKESSPDNDEINMHGPFASEKDAQDFIKTKKMVGYKVGSYQDAEDHAGEWADNFGRGGLEDYADSIPHEIVNQFKELHNDFNGDTSKVIDHVSKNLSYGHDYTLVTWPRRHLVAAFGEDHPYVKYVDSLHDKLSFKGYHQTSGGWNGNWDNYKEVEIPKGSLEYNEDGTKNVDLDKSTHPWYLDYRKSTTGQ